MYPIITIRDSTISGNVAVYLPSNMSSNNVEQDTHSTVTLNPPAKRSWTNAEGDENATEEPSTKKRQRRDVDEQVQSEKPANDDISETTPDYVRVNLNKASPTKSGRYALCTTRAVFQEHFQELISDIALPKAAMKLLKSRANKVGEKMDNSKITSGRNGNQVTEMLRNFLQLIYDDMISFIGRCKTFRSLSETVRDLLTGAVKKAAEFAASAIGFVW